MCTFVQLIYLFNLKFNKMKKLLVLSVVAIAAFTFSSCGPKDCKCTASSKQMPDISESVTFTGKELKDAGYKNCGDLYDKYVKNLEIGDIKYECVEE